jgi:type II secretory ATPase GspE/PulE/Tfp pilus assembly ATPase PilB-like protein/CheY-like chemotaxis protein
MQFTDEWLLPTMETLVASEELETLRNAPGAAASLWESTVQKKLTTDDRIMAAAAERFRLPVADFTKLELKVRESVPETLARRFNVLPLRITDSYIEVATANPFDIDAEKLLAFATGREVRMQLAPPGKIRDKLEEVYRPENVVSKLLGGMEDSTVEQLEDEPLEDLASSAEEASQRPIIRLVDLLLSDGILSRASDIHVEPAEGGVVVRYRIDGVLRQAMKIPRTAGLPLISRLKIISSLDIADRLRPQDGRARVSVNGSPVDLRVSTLPATLGEKVVIRILNAKATVLTLESLGMHQDEQEAIANLLTHKEGIVLVTGPTGSGKTTTLYSALRLVQSEGVNIVTVEDPVEYRLGANIVQVQVNEKAGLTFAAALRSILRQDPDVVLLGEIRDQETAKIAVQASLTGHLVLSTLHTNDAPNAVTRLVDMGLEAYKLASALRGIVAQRLMRRLCSTCREPHTGEIPAKLRRYIPQGATLYRSVGCPECSMTGYHGRYSIVEVLTMSPELERRIGSGATADRIAEAARENGMKSLWESGLRHVLAGDSALDELLRVTGAPVTETASASAPAPAAPSPRHSQGSTPVAPPAAPAPAVDLSTAFDLVDDGPQPTTRRQATILLVDDEDQLRRVMRDLLEREGYAVAEARDGVQALDEVDRHAPDVIVLDLNLPGLDGYSVLSQLRSREHTRGIPVIVLTAKGDEDNEVRVFELGADDFLTKPFRARALSARLEALLGRRRLKEGSQGEAK